MPAFSRRESGTFQVQFCYPKELPKKGKTLKHVSLLTKDSKQARERYQEILMLEPRLYAGEEVSVSWQSDPIRLRRIYPYLTAYTYLVSDNSDKDNVFEYRDKTMEDFGIDRVLLSQMFVRELQLLTPYSQGKEYVDEARLNLIASALNVILPEELKRLLEEFDVSKDTIFSRRSSARCTFLKYIILAELDYPEAEKVLCAVSQGSTNYLRGTYGFHRTIIDPKFVSDTLYYWACETFPKISSLERIGDYRLYMSQVLPTNSRHKAIHLDHRRQLASIVELKRCESCGSHAVPSNIDSTRCRGCINLPSVDKAFLEGLLRHKHSTRRDEIFKFAQDDIRPFAPDEPIRAASLPSIMSFDQDTQRIKNIFRLKELRWYDLPSSVSSFHYQARDLLRANGTPVTLHEEDILDTQALHDLHFINLDFYGSMTDEIDAKVRDLLIRCLPNKGYLTVWLNFSLRISGGKERYYRNFRIWPELFACSGARIEMINHYSYDGGSGPMFLTVLALTKAKEIKTNE